MIGLDLLDISVVACEKLEFGIIVVNYLSCLKVAIFLWVNVRKLTFAYYVSPTEAGYSLKCITV